MKGRRLVLLQCGCLIVLFAPVSARAAKNPLDNQTVIRMAQAGIGARTIIYEIEVSKPCFHVLPENLIILKENGVPGTVIREMIAVEQKAAKCESPKKNASAEKTAGQQAAKPGSGTGSAASVKTVAQFSGSTVLAKYVAGSDPKGEKILNKLGCLTWTRGGKSGSLVFVSYGNIHKIHRALWFGLHLADPSWAKGGGHCNDAPRKPKKEKKKNSAKSAARNSSNNAAGNSAMGTLPAMVEIPFDQIKVVSNGRVTTIGQPSSGAIQSLLAIAGVGGLISSLASSSTAASTKIWLGASAGSVALVAAGIYLNRRTNNYITIIYKKDSEGEKSAENPDEKLVIQTQVTTRKAECGYDCGQATGNYFPAGSEKTVTTRVPKPADAPGKCQGGCNIAVFQIIDPHDWWNTTMFLQARTGLPVVPEGSIFGGGSAPAPAKSK